MPQPQTPLAILAFLAIPALAAAEWPQWGGPNRDFTVKAANLAKQWPEGGPKVLWDRALGEQGYSAIVGDAKTIYTMYRQVDDEVVIALEASTGKTVWQHRYPAPIRKENDPQFGGTPPGATPLLAGGRVYAVGYTAMLHCLDAQSGKVLWKHDLIRAFQAPILECGYTISPLAYQNTLIVLVGSKDHGVIAFDLKDGSVAWKSGPFAFSEQKSQGFHASPFVINVAGEDQLVFMSSIEVIGIDPRTGAARWKHPHTNHWKYNCAAPVWGRDGQLYVASHGDGGSRLLKLDRKDGKTTVEQVWHTAKAGLYFKIGIRLGDHLYGSSAQGVFAQDLKTGEVAWKERHFPAAHALHVDGRMIYLTEKGLLGLATVSPEKITVHSRFQLFPGDDVSWTPPTLIGGTLYARDKRRMVAVKVD